MPGGAESPMAATSGPHIATQWPNPPRKPVASAMGMDASIVPPLRRGHEREAGAPLLPVAEAHRDVGDPVAAPARAAHDRAGAGPRPVAGGAERDHVLP